MSTDIFLLPNKLRILSDFTTPPISMTYRQSMKFYMQFVEIINFIEVNSLNLSQLFISHSIVKN